MEREIQNGAFDFMTEEQTEILRKQIAIYAVISDQLRRLLHNSLSSGGGYFDPSSSSDHKISARPRCRWTPTSRQLQILENIYKEGKGTPNPKRIKEITTELSQHGKIMERNVYNWFQNRRARSKRKQPQAATTAGQAVDAAVTTEERSCGDSGGFESYEHILFPTSDLGIEHLLNG